MIFVGIDVAKNKHDGYIFDSSKKMIEPKFSFLNSFEGFTTFKNVLSLYLDDFSNIKVGIATKRPLITIPGISYVLASIILSEIGNVKNFSNSGKLLAFAGLEPSTHQSGNYTATMSRMVSLFIFYLLF